MTLQKTLDRLSSSLAPRPEQERAILTRIQKRIKEPVSITALERSLVPSKTQADRVWERILARITAPLALSFLEKLRQSIQEGLAIPTLLFPRLHLEPIPAKRFFTLKLAGVFLLSAFIVRTTPLLFLAPSIAAGLPVTLVPGTGAVELSEHGLWQQVMQRVELPTAGGIVLQTRENSHATILLHDDGTLRLDANTAVRLDDLLDRPSKDLLRPTATLERGRLWVQGILPEHVTGLLIALPNGMVIVRGGSVSIDVGTKTTVTVWDRTATFVVDGQTTVIAAGEMVDITQGGPVILRQVRARAPEDSWVTENLDMDAFQRREIAQAQQERRAAAAGILPTSSLYPVKRAAEALDLLLTIGEDARLEKKLALASTRLNEAAAMLPVDAANAEASLQEYRTSLQDALGASEASPVVTETLVANTADISAALPGESGYALKQTVLEVGSAIAPLTIDERDVRATILLDSIDRFGDAIASGDRGTASEAFQQIRPRLVALSDATMLRPQAQNEASTMLRKIAYDMQTGNEEIPSEEMRDALLPFAPKPPRTPEVAIPMTEEELATDVAAAIDRIYGTYKMPQSRENQLKVELKRMQGSIDEGRFLRALYHALPEDSDLRKTVRRAIQLLRELQIARSMGLVHDAAPAEGDDGAGSGAELPME